MMAKRQRLKIALGPKGNSDCSIVDLDTGQAIEEVRRVRIDCAVGEITTAEVQILMPEIVEAEVLATVVPESYATELNRLQDELRALTGRLHTLINDMRKGRGAP